MTVTCLERAFSRIFEVGDGKVEIYNTTYSGYLEERAQREEMEAATLRKNKSLYRKELAWIRRGAPARSTKAKGRIQRFDAVAEAIKEAPPEAELTMKSVASRLGKKILSWENLSIGYGENTLVRDFSYTLLRDDRLGIIGGNAQARRRSWRTLCGELPPLSGVIEKGDTVRIGYFAQHCPALDPDTRIIDAVKDVAVHVYTPDGDLSASQMAETFLFPSQMPVSEGVQPVRRRTAAAVPPAYPDGCPERADSRRADERPRPRDAEYLGGLP